MRQNEKIFSQMYDGTLNWGSDESESGPGSTLEATAHIRENLKFLLKILPIETFCDLPCGDFNFMTNVDFGTVKYIGCDIVKTLVEKNQENFGNKNRAFYHIDIVNEQCPSADLVFCKDLFIHLSNDDIKKAINNIVKSQAKYFMSSTAFLPKIVMPGRKVGTIELPDTNVDVPPDARHGYLMGDRIINLFASPFALPDSIYLVGSANKFQIMALWKIEDLPDFESPE
jgi:hypothetical protein